MSNPILANIQELESREEHFLELIKKRDLLLKELQDLSNNFPVVVENNKKGLIFKHNNSEFLNKFNTELNKISSEQQILIQNLRSSLKDKVEKLALTEKYKIIRKEEGLTKEELLNLLYEELITERFESVEFVI
jgi:hypothetical protein